MGADGIERGKKMKKENELTYAELIALSRMHERAKKCCDTNEMLRIERFLTERDYVYECNVYKNGDYARI